MAFQLSNIQKQSQSRASSTDVASILSKEIYIFKKAFSNKIKEDFYTEIAVLLKAGITLKDTLQLIAKSVKKKTHQELISEMVEQLVSGASFSEILNQNKHFSNYEYYSIKIGEESGTLNQVAEQLGSYYALKNEQKRNLISALTYPIIICATAVLVVVFMLHFVVPMFQDIFKQQGVELPSITKFIIKCSEFINNYGLLLVFGFLVIFISKSFINKKKWYKKTMSTVTLKIPYIGGFVNTVYLAQFSQAVSLLTASKVPMVTSISLVKQMLSFYPLQKALDAIEHDLVQGKSLSKSMASHQLFNHKMIALVKVAEETNQTDFIFKRLNMQYNTQLQQQSKVLATIMEPLIIIIVGLAVGIILVAMYLPMFKLSSVLG